MIEIEFTFSQTVLLAFENLLDTRSVFRDLPSPRESANGSALVGPLPEGEGICAALILKILLRRLPAAARGKMCGRW